MRVSGIINGNGIFLLKFCHYVLIDFPDIQNAKNVIQNNEINNKSHLQQ